MQLTVVGSIAYDTVTTPNGKIERGYGGSAVYFSIAASLFNPVHMIGVIGEDYELDFLKRLRKKKIDSSGVEIRKGEKTFFWKGHYEGSMNEAVTEVTELNSFATFKPVIRENAKNSDYLFLANIDPELQINVLKQINRPRVVVCDTMNYWIATKKDALTDLFKMVDAVILNEGELSLFTGGKKYLDAIDHILGLGPRVLIVKKGCYGVDAISKDFTISLPAYLTRDVKDPTGAGDSFGGGMMGFLASRKKMLDRQSLATALAFGTVVASFNIEDFSIFRLFKISKKEIKDRFDLYKQRIKI